MNIATDEYNDALIPGDIDYLKTLKPLINLSLIEGLKLCWLASLAEHNIVEIGSYMGRSACFLAAGSKAGNKCKVTCIEPWHQRNLKFDTRSPEKLNIFAKLGIREQFDRQTEPYKNLIIAKQGYSAQIAKAWNAPVGLIFIDGNHNEAYTDFELWHRHIVSGGVMAFHDINFPHVAEQIHKIKKSQILKNWVTINRLAYAQKR